MSLKSDQLELGFCICPTKGMLVLYMYGLTPSMRGFHAFVVIFFFKNSFRMIWIKIRTDVLCVLSLVPSSLQRLSADSINLEGTLIFLYIRRLGSFFLFQIFYFNIFWGFQKNIFWGIKILWIIFGSPQKMDYI